MKRLLFLAAVLLPNCTGCVAFAYPTIQHVPELTVPNPDGSVHAFRVDIDTTTTFPNTVETKYTLSRIPIDARGMIPSQLELAPATGVYNPFGVTGVAEERSNYTMLVRVYRPGYRTIEVQAWDKSRELIWLPAADLAAQEKAIDDLLGLPAQIGEWWKPRIPLNSSANSHLFARKYPSIGDTGLQSGSVSSMHRQALQFAGNEYARLANGPLANAPTMQPVRERLQQKAVFVRFHADGSLPKMN